MRENLVGGRGKGERDEFMVFGEDYLKYKAFFTPGYFLHVKGKVQDRYKQEGNLEFKITGIQLLTDLRRQKIKQLTINIPLSRLDESLINEMFQCINKFNDASNATCNVRFLLVDSEEGLDLTLPARKLRVDPSNELITALEKFQGITYRLN